MYRAVARRQLRTLRPCELAEGVVQRLSGQTTVKLRDALAQPLRSAASSFSTS